jgi:thymidine phosphorylase
MGMQLTFLGAVGTVTGSKYLLETDGKRILVDCGLFQGYKQLRLRNRAPFPVNPGSIDAVVLTHAHLDHSGYLPLLVKNGFSGPVICTEATCDLCAILLPDSGHLLEKDAEFANRHGFSKHRPALPLYTLKDAEASLRRFAPITFGTEKALPGNMQLCFRPAGHILGAAIVELTHRGTKVVFSGDLGRPNSATMIDPTPIRRADYLLVESTYGNRLHDPQDPEDALADVINRTAGRGGTVLIPSFAVGRSQTLMYHLHRLKGAHRIPNLPIFLDSPMAEDASEIFCKDFRYQKLDAGQCRATCAVAHYIRNVEESKALDHDPMPKIIISASGMATGGRILHHLKSYAPDPRNTVLFAGFQASGTRGAAMTAGAESVKIHGQYVPVRAEVANLHRLVAELRTPAENDLHHAWRAGCRRRSPPPYRGGAGMGLFGAGASRNGGTPMTSDPSTEMADKRQHAQLNILRARRLGINTQHEAVIFMREDCHICRAEGFTAHTRIRIDHGEHSIIATLYQVSSDILHRNEAGLSEAAWRRLKLQDGASVKVSHPAPLESLSMVRGKVYGRHLEPESLATIISDITAGRYSDIHLSSFITACSARPLDRSETTSLTRAMIDVGDHLSWNVHPVVDKHCVGGLPGNRTTPIIVSIVAACGLVMPKTSSRAITSPAGTADTMEVLAPVDLDLPTMRRVVEREGGCIVWGGAVHLSPADDILIRVERALDLDSEGQLIASVLSKKIAAGSSHVVLDIPVGPTAKVRNADAAHSLAQELVEVAQSFDLQARAVITDGSQPVGHGIGPALEARDVLAVLSNAPNAPHDLRERALVLAGTLLELGGKAALGEGQLLAATVLDSGRAMTKFQGICEAQGGMREPKVAAHRHAIKAHNAGRAVAVDNRRLARVAKLAGAPDAKVAGVEVHVSLGDEVDRGQPLFTIHAESPGELDYALAYAGANNDIYRVTAP